MVEQFRASGLSHLTAVSGQNVAFLLAAAAPLLRRLRPWTRWTATVALIGWFMSVTRFEPSVLRAGAMLPKQRDDIVTALSFARALQADLEKAIVRASAQDPAVKPEVALDQAVAASAGFLQSAEADLALG